MIWPRLAAALGCSGGGSLARASLRRVCGSSSVASSSGAAPLKTVAELDPALLAKARRMAALVGTAAGAFGSLVGVGGGVLIGPVILNACPAIPQRVISGTSLAAVATTGATAGAVFWGSGCVEPRAALLLAGSAVALAPLGARMTHRVDCQRLRQALGYWLYFVAPLVPLKALLFAQPQPEPQPDPQPGAQPQQPGQQAARELTGTGMQQRAQLEPPSGRAPAGLGASLAASSAAAVAPPPSGQGASTSSGGGSGCSQAGSGGLGGWALSVTDLALLATGCLAGFASGMLGIGGGTVVTPLLALTTGASQPVVLGTSLAAMVLPSLVGLAQHTRLGNVDWRMAAALGAGTSAGSYLGSQLAVTAPPGLLEALFAAGMLLLGRKTLAAAAKGVPAAAK